MKSAWEMDLRTQELQQELARLREEKEKLMGTLKMAREAIREFKGILSAHEYAIRSDCGNTNLKCFQDKAREALAAIDAMKVGEE